MVDGWMPYMRMLVSMTFTFMPLGHRGSAKATNQRCLLSATKKAISIKLATTVGHFLCDLDHHFANVYMACPACLAFDVSQFVYNHVSAAALYKGDPITTYE